MAIVKLASHMKLKGIGSYSSVQFAFSNLSRSWLQIIIVIATMILFCFVGSLSLVALFIFLFRRLSVLFQPIRPQAKSKCQTNFAFSSQFWFSVSEKSSRATKLYLLHKGTYWMQIGLVRFKRDGKCALKSTNNQFVNRLSLAYNSSIVRWIKWFIQYNGQHSLCVHIVFIYIY